MKPNVQSAYIVSVGNPFPYGPSISAEGINFSLYSRHASTVSLCLWTPESDKPTEIVLDPKINRSGDVWHILVHDLPKSISYGYIIDGPRKINPYYNSKNLLIDPYAKAVSSSRSWGISKGEYRPHCEVLDLTEPFDWQNVKSPGTPLKDLIIYEMHVRGFTQDQSSGSEHRGKFLGVIDKIPYLKDLGINAVKLLPVHEFNELELKTFGPLTHQKLYNYWGYNTLQYFTPMNRYVEGTKPEDGIREFKTMVRELHRNGIEVILDVVFNHTGEGNEKGLISSFKGIDNSVYYMVNKHGQYLDFTGCGNTVSCNHPVVIDFIKDCLRYWVTEMRVDGFRFDLGAIFMRDNHGKVLAHPPILDILTHDPILANAKLIAEPWDAAGLYELGKFYPQEKRWSEWNGKYRDSVRSFIKGDKGAKKDFATRICGSQDLFWNRSPASSINFVTAHDGFSLADLVSYNKKHNEDNGENNRDGINENDSWNCGEEGYTTDKEILALRERQMRNFMLALMLSQGVPMISMGDEYGHSCRGNNNPWCHDSTLNWFNWKRLDENGDFFNFYRKLLQFRRDHGVLRQDRFLTDKDILWHGEMPLVADWGDQNTLLAFTLLDLQEGGHLYAAFNPSNKPIEVTVPACPDNKKWQWVVNTDLVERNSVENKITMVPYSSLLLKAN